MFPSAKNKRDKDLHNVPLENVKNDVFKIHKKKQLHSFM